MGKSRPQNQEFGFVGGYLIGAAMKEMVRRAIEKIRAERFVFESRFKRGYDGKDNDVVTSADKAAQEIYVNMIHKCFPSLGIIAEEEEFRVEGKDGFEDIYFTVDPLDGSKAFRRRQSDGIGTMISLIKNGNIVAAYVGNVMTQEIFGYHPESKNVNRISEYNRVEPLKINPRKSLAAQYLLLGEAVRKHSAFSQEKIIMAEKENRIFKDYEIGRGGIGVAMSRLWKGEIGGMILMPTHDTPWDFCPIIGISERLEFIFMKINSEDGKCEQIRPLISKRVERRDFEILIIHKSRLDEIKNLC